MKRQITLALATFIAAVAMGRISFAADPAFDARDEGFLHETANRQLLMVRLGDYAAKHAESTDVKRLGQEVAQQQGDARQEAMNLAKEHQTDLHINEKLLPTQKEYYDRLTKKGGINFDKDYTKWLVAQYTQEIKQYQLERDHAHADAVREYASKMLPQLQSQLTKVRQVEKQVWGM